MVQYSQPSPSSQHGRFSQLWTKKLETPFSSFTKRSILIAVMGMTGAGKTYFIKHVTGLEEMEIGHGLKSCKYIPIYLGVILTPIYRHERNSDRNNTH